MRIVHALIAVFFLALALAGAARADVVELADGTRLEGRVMRRAADGSIELQAAQGTPQTIPADRLVKVRARTSARDRR